MPATPEQEQAVEDEGISAEEAALVLFVVVALHDSDEEEDRKLAKFTLRTFRRLFKVYGWLFSDGSITQVSAKDIPDATKKALKKSVKALKKSIGEESITPEQAASFLGRQAFGLLTIDLATLIDSSDSSDLSSDSSGSSKSNSSKSRFTKTWVTRGDSRVRSLHVKLNGKTKKIDQDFWRWPTTGQTISYPGDPKAPIEATANCRCFLILNKK